MLAQLTLYTLGAANAKKKGGGNFVIEDFLPQFGEPEPEREATFDDFANLFKPRSK
jgi:hypothetical protein